MSFKKAMLLIGLGVAGLAVSMFRHSRVPTAQSPPEASESREPDVEQPDIECTDQKRWSHWMFLGVMLAMAVVSVVNALRKLQESGFNVTSFLVYFILPASIPAAVFWRSIAKRDEGGPPATTFLVIVWLAIVLGFTQFESFDAAWSFLLWVGGVMGALTVFSVINRPVVAATKRLAEAYHRHNS